MGNKKANSPGEISAVSAARYHWHFTPIPRLYQIFLVKQRDKFLLDFCGTPKEGAMSTFPPRTRKHYSTITLIATCRTQHCFNVSRRQNYYYFNIEPSCDHLEKKKLIMIMFIILFFFFETGNASYCSSCFGKNPSFLCFATKQS